MWSKRHKRPNSGFCRNSAKADRKEDNARAELHCSALCCPAGALSAGILPLTSTASIRDTCEKDAELRWGKDTTLTAAPSDSKLTGKFKVTREWPRQSSIFFFFNAQMCVEVCNLKGMSGFHHIPKYCRRKEFRYIAQPGPPPTPNRKGEVSVRI